MAEEFSLGFPRVPLFPGKDLYQQTRVVVKVNNRKYDARVIANIEGKAQVQWEYSENKPPNTGLATIIDLKYITKSDEFEFEFGDFSF
jgi:hypothetical protein